jgi:hypothetical protein
MREWAAKWDLLAWVKDNGNEKLRQAAGMEMGQMLCGAGKIDASFFKTDLL